ncbi:hypothetical protein [Streptomyces sp. NPDC059171]|uniref:hypothetical protein n=1 Tax=Streptomyces sp. NPDC059171 TaxID=3346755 RepID=UPI0036824EFA
MDKPPTPADRPADQLRDRLRAAAQRALESLDSLIADHQDPGAEALGARYELARELSNTSPEVARQLLATSVAEGGEDTVGLCGYCGVPRETHHHGYVSTAAALAAAPRHVTAAPPVPAVSERVGVVQTMLLDAVTTGTTPPGGWPALLGRYRAAIHAAGVRPATADRAALTETERQLLGLALELAEEEIHARNLEIPAKDRAALTSLRRLAADAAAGVQPPTSEAHPAEHTWAAELHDPLANEWVPGTRYVVRDRAVNALEHGRKVAPLWKDGTPTERRLVRATTTYTVEPEPAAPAAPEETTR